jgi:prevent-host-death family protein
MATKTVARRRPAVGVREFKNRATQLVRSVKDGAEYVVTVSGKPVAVLRPYTTEDAAADSADSVEAALARWRRHAADISARVPPGTSVVDILTQMREERQAVLEGRGGRVADP